MLLGKCEFGKDDYSLNIVNLPNGDDESTNIDNNEISAEKKVSKFKKKRADDQNQPSLFK